MSIIPYSKYIFCHKFDVLPLHFAVLSHIFDVKNYPFFFKPKEAIQNSTVFESKHGSSIVHSAVS